jgi:hypothetical protein
MSFAMQRYKHRSSLLGLVPVVCVISDAGNPVLHAWGAAGLRLLLQMCSTAMHVALHRVSAYSPCHGPRNDAMTTGACTRSSESTNHTCESCGACDSVMLASPCTHLHVTLTCHTCLTLSVMEV